MKNIKPRHRKTPPLFCWVLVNKRGEITRNFYDHSFENFKTRYETEDKRRRYNRISNERFFIKKAEIIL